MVGSRVALHDLLGLDSLVLFRDSMSVTLDPLLFRQQLVARDSLAVDLALLARSRSCTDTLRVCRLV